MARHPLHIIDRGSTFVVRGNARPLLEAVGIRALFVGADARGWVADKRHLRDLLAFLDAHRVAYVVTVAGEAA